MLCFESSSLNEIEGVLNVKDFQMKYVINHHVVNYEQELLVREAKHAALHFFPSQRTANDPGYAALNKIVNINALTGEVITETGHLRLTNISDDDLIFLMKQDSGNSYYQQWCSREYIHFSLWKSRDEFYHYFPNVSKMESLKNNSFEKEVRKTLNEKGYNDDEILVTKAEFKGRVRLRKLFLVVANDVVRYTDIKPEEENSNKTVEFYYVFVSKRGITNREEIKKIRKELIDALKETMAKLYQEDKKTLRERMRSTWLCRMICGN